MSSAQSTGSKVLYGGDDIVDDSKNIRWTERGCYVHPFLVYVTATPSHYFSLSHSHQHNPAANRSGWLKFSCGGRSSSRHSWAPPHGAPPPWQGFGGCIFS